VIVPIVHEYEAPPPVDALTAGLVPLQIVPVTALTVGVGLTVNVNGVAAPAQLFAVGVTLYTTLPDAELLGLVKFWLIADPLALLAPVIPPVIVPIVHE